MEQIRALDKVLAHPSVCSTVFVVYESDGDKGVALNLGFKRVK